MTDEKYRHTENLVFLKNQNEEMTDLKFRHPERSVESDIFNLSRVGDSRLISLENDMAICF